MSSFKSIYLLLSISVIFISTIFAGFVSESDYNYYRQPGVRKYILGAQVAKPNQFPYQVYLKSTAFPHTLTLDCSGSLISNEFVLTAAHCIFTNKIEKLENGSLWRHDYEFTWVWDTEITLGVHNHNNPNEKGYKKVYVPAMNFLMHEEYEPLEHLNDIALIKLPEKIELNQYIKTISLPPRNLPDLTDKTVIHAGWGVINAVTKKTPSELRYASFVVLDHNTCNHKFMNSIHKDLHICIKNHKDDDLKQACGGDSGGPLILENSNGQKYQIGISSFGFTCGKDWPSVFTRVSHYLDWIAEKTKIK